MVLEFLIDRQGDPASSSAGIAFFVWIGMKNRLAENCKPARIAPQVLSAGVRASSLCESGSSLTPSTVGGAMIARTSKRRGSGRKPSVLYTSHVKDGKDTGSQFTPLAFDAPPTTGRILVLPGKLPRRLFFVSFDACEIALTPNELELLVNVAYWRVTTTLGLTPFCNSDSKDSLHQTIKRLRASIDAHMGSGHGKLIIEHSNDSLYFLAVDVIIVHPLFPEIAAGSVGDCFRLSNSKVDIVDDLIRHCPFPSPDNPICQRFAKALSVVAL